MGRVLEAIAPARIGPSFRWLVAAGWTSNLGDGLAMAAGPLLVARLAGSSPLLVALAATLQWLPPLVLGLVAGVVTDRVDRRRVVIAAGLLRVVVLGVLVAAITTGAVTVGVVLAALLLLGIAEVFGDNAESTLLPVVVHRDDLALGNARLLGGFITMQNLVGPPVGALLFAAGAAWPFVGQAVLLAAGAALVARVVMPRAERASAAPHREIAEALRWTWRHAGVRTLVLTILLFNVTYGAAWSVLVLYATDRLGLGPVGYGAITAVIAAGGIVATVGYGALTRRVSLAALMRVGLVVETLTHLALALTTTPWIAYVVFAVFGAHAFVWGTTSITVRQRAVPQALQGRVGSVNTVATFGGLVVGSGVGGALAQGLGVVAPFWFAFAGSALLVVLLWRQLGHIAHADPGTARPVEG